MWKVPGRLFALLQETLFAKIKTPALGIGLKSLDNEISKTHRENWEHDHPRPTPASPYVLCPRPGNTLTEFSGDAEFQYQFLSGFSAWRGE